MKPKLLLFLLFGAVSVLGKRPPWYKPCWIYLCGLDMTNPVCAWDPHRGARLFRNTCELERHNFCYNRNYAVVDSDNTAYEDAQLCNKLTGIVEGEEGKEKEGVVEDGNVRVHFIEDTRPGDSRRNRNDNVNMKRPSSQHRMWTSDLDIDSSSFSSSAQHDHDFPFKER